MMGITVASLMAISMLSAVALAGKWYGNELSVINSISTYATGHLDSIESLCGCMLGVNQ
ncbi:MAG: hypothetical protein KGH69_00945 [Candidatus Micrarchaeota archaeon]|nr:hypothetical protein [Candidatus Micrarchaeota archaeon]